MIDFIKDKFDKKGYEFFSEMESFKLNIFAVRSAYQLKKSASDFIYVLYRDHKMDWRIIQRMCITNVMAYVDDPSSITGTLVLAPGQYKEAYSVGEHTEVEGKRKNALVQRQPVNVLRDGNPETPKEDAGYHGCDITSIPEFKSYKSGAIMFSNFLYFKEFMKIILKSHSIYEQNFNFTLFDEIDMDINGKFGI